MPPKLENTEKDPFKEKLQKSEYDSDTLQELSSLPGKIIRKMSLDVLETDTDKETAHEAAVKSRELINELSSKYGISVPNFEMVIGYDEEYGEQVLYIFEDKVKGDNLSKIEYDKKETPRISKQLDELYTKLIIYIFDKYTKGGYYLPEMFFSNEQFVFSINNKGEKKEIYLVDIDPFFEKFNPLDREQIENTNIFYHLNNFSKMIIESEQKLNESLSQTRTEFNKLLNNLPSLKEFEEILTELRKRLNF
jgi:hypothetical protein